MTPRLKEKYKNEIIKNLMSKLNQKNMHGVPRIKKIVCRLINRKFWLTEKDNKTPNNPRIKINIKLSLSIEFQKFFIFISLIYLKLID